MSLKRNLNDPPDGFGANAKAARFLNDLLESGTVDHLEPREIHQNYDELANVSLKNVRERIYRQRKAKEQKEIGKLKSWICSGESTNNK